MLSKCGFTQMLESSASRWAAPVLIVASLFVTGCAAPGAGGAAPVFGGCHSYVFCSDATEPPAEGKCCVDGRAAD